MPVANPNYFTGNPLERLSEKRGDAAWVEAQLSTAGGRLIPFWKGMPLIEMPAGDSATGQPLWLNPMATSEFAGDAPLILLGHKNGTPYFAIDGSGNGSAPDSAPFSDMGDYKSLREIAHILERDDLAILGQALWLLDWHRRHRFCANCGAPTEMRAAGALRYCGSCETEHFPRTDPVAIVLPIHDDACLLGRGINFPANLFSALAGFMEPGETLEECAVREVYEEAGVRLTDMRYIFSQPWPFPSSLMVGFFAAAASRELTLDPTEIAAARWVPKAEISALLNGERRDDLWIPPKLAIAHQLLAVWVNE